MAHNALVDRFLTGWSNNLLVLLDALAGDIDYYDAPLQARLKGKEELSAFAANFFTALPDIRFTLASAPIETDTNLVFGWRLTGTQAGQLLDIPATGRSVDVEGVSLINIAGGKITSVSDYWDMATLLRQLDRLPS